MTSLTNDTKNTAALTLPSKRSRTWAQATVVWKPGDSRWNNTGSALALSSKNTVSLTNESKA